MKIIRAIAIVTAAASAALSVWRLYKKWSETSGSSETQTVSS